MKLITLLIISFFSLGPSISEHAIYVSVIEVTVEEEKVGVMIKLFEDDFRDALRSTYDRSYLEVSNADSIDVASYFYDHFVLSDTNGKLHLKLTDVSRVGDSYRINMIGTIGVNSYVNSIEADYLMDLFPDQKNILHFNNGSKKQFEILDIKKHQVVLNRSY